jgi:hypothetical protein
VPSPCPRRGLGRGATLVDATVRVVVLLSGVGASIFALRLDESASVRCRALHLSRRHRCAAFADLSSDKERLGSGRGFLRRASILDARNLTPNPFPSGKGNRSGGRGKGEWRGERAGEES